MTTEGPLHTEGPHTDELTTIIPAPASQGPQHTDELTTIIPAPEVDEQQPPPQSDPFANILATYTPEQNAAYNRMHEKNKKSSDRAATFIMIGLLLFVGLFVLFIILAIVQWVKTRSGFTNPQQIHSDIQQPGFFDNYAAARAKYSWVDPVVYEKIRMLPDRTVAGISSVLSGY